MAQWIRFEHGGRSGFGVLEREFIVVHSGDMFEGADPTGEKIKLADAKISRHANRRR